jgi:hypothetical protein
MDELRERYPDGNPDDDDTGWVLLEHMTPEGVRFNIDRLRRVGQAQLEHADRLMEWARRKWPDFEM